ncbi:glycoside hydrolase [Halogeometricum luteum]|uniref:Glycoside hydrolase n=1 Tax=Halogeometricum luteum TaxID=2950537 RepID=A0ABU2FZ69_9EURY|nr:glycoside hydrolase [Halogeometricum sp. S3BR5-2]MDS0293837.1 glycoside hydrolase [Halogeometricum sp. S3BR5-2]
MDSEHRRREFLKISAAATGLASVGGRAAGRRVPAPDGASGGDSAPRSGPADCADGASVESAEPIDVRGAMYLPARALTFYQMWADYDEAVIERDLGYAADVNLNAVRTWPSYEFWKREPAAHERRIDHFLRAASERGISVLFSLFEGNGVWPTEENLTDDNPFTGVGVRSPGNALLADRSRWGEAERFVEWFAERYGDDDRLLAVEAMNEPHWDSRTKPFARSMFETLARNRGSVPLTVGSTSMVNNATYLDWGVDALQFHYNFPRSEERYRRFLDRMRGLADEFDGPTWLGEWQRVRSPPFGPCPPNDDHTYPNYASLAPAIRDSGFGNFFWSLMVKPAYLPPMRGNGVLNGLFHEDGAVWSLEDARAIKAMSGDPSVDGLEERSEWPEWAAGVKEFACR